MNIGDLIIWRGRAYRLRGFDPMSVPDPHAYLHDEETGERVVAPAAELEEPPPNDLG